MPVQAASEQSTRSRAGQDVVSGTYHPILGLYIRPGIRIQGGRSLLHWQWQNDSTFDVA